MVPAGLRVDKVSFDFQWLKAITVLVVGLGN